MNFCCLFDLVTRVVQFFEARRVFFEVKFLYSSTSFIANTGIAVLLQFAEHGSEYSWVPEFLA